MKQYIVSFTLTKHTLKGQMQTWGMMRSQEAQFFTNSGLGGIFQEWSFPSQRLHVFCKAHKPRTSRCKTVPSTTTVFWLWFKERHLNASLKGYKTQGFVSATAVATKQFSSKKFPLHNFLYNQSPLHCSQEAGTEYKTSQYQLCKTKTTHYESLYPLLGFMSVNMVDIFMFKMYSFSSNVLCIHHYVNLIFHFYHPHLYMCHKHRSLKGRINFAALSSKLPYLLQISEASSFST